MHSGLSVKRVILFGVTAAILTAPTVIVTAGGAGAGAAQQPMGSAIGAVPRDLGPGEVFQGTPWTGAPGITETVAEIMAREARTPLVVAGPPRERRPEQAEGLDRPKAENPDAPAVSRWPAGPDPPAPRLREDGSPQQALSLSTNWLGPRLSEAGVIPPDSNGAVGPTQVMAIGNGRFKLYNKTGTLQGLNVTDTTFFSTVSGGVAVSDPHIRYDRLSGRWFITEITVSNTSNRILLAVSSSSTITDATSFTFFQFAHDSVGPTPNIDTGHFADYDTLGVDANALYIGVNEFASSVGTFQNTSGYVVRKADLLAGTLTVTAFRGLAVGAGAGLWTPQGVDNDDPSAAEGYFIGVDNEMFSKLQIRRVSTPGGTPSISGNISLTVPTTVFPIFRQVAMGSTIPLDGLDDRLFAAGIHKNKLTGVSSLWTAHNIQVDTTGTASNAGGRNGSRWYQIDNLTTTPTLTQSGTVFHNAASNPFSFWIPSIMANGQGHVALGASAAGNTLAPSYAYAARYSSDAIGSMGQPLWSIIFGVAGYNVQTSGTRQRWGDYSQVVVDANDDMTLWTFQEYCDATNSWGVRVMKLMAPPPATPASASPASVRTGLASTDITITGTSEFGSGFFDPGAGFASRLVAAVSGGVVVNSVTFVDATHLTLNVSTVGASIGARDVTVTNPDGQQKTATSLFSVSNGFTDDPLTAGTTLIKAAHVTELRARIDAQRQRFGLGPYGWANVTLTPAGTVVIQAVHIIEMRTALGEAYAAHGFAQPGYTDSPLASGTVVKAIHITQLRNAVVALEGS